MNICDRRTRVVTGTDKEKTLSVTTLNRPDNNTEKKDDEQTNTEPPKPCKDHGKNVRCMKCISGSSTARTQRVTGNVHGFKFNN